MAEEMWINSWAKKNKRSDFFTTTEANKENPTYLFNQPLAAEEKREDAISSDI